MTETERAVQKLQLLKAGIVLCYVSSVKKKIFFQSAMKLMIRGVSRLKRVTDESVITHHAYDSTNHRLFLKFREILRIC